MPIFPAKARTELAFIRTGVAFIALATGLMRYFGVGWWTITDAVIFILGMAMVTIGIYYYLPTRKQEDRLIDLIRQKEEDLMGKKFRILVLDDDPNVCKTSEFYLSKEGYHVEASIDPFAAKERLEATEFDVVITDLMMEGKVDIENNQQLIRAEKELKELAMNAEVPPEISYLIEKKSREIEERAGRKLFWAVRSSAIGEDLENSFAGQFSTVLNVPTEELVTKYKEVISSKYNARAIVYRKIKNIRDDDISMSVGIVEMVHPLCSGVLYTTDPVKPEKQEIIINAVWGLGQLLVDGVISADIFVLDRSDGFRIKKREIAEKQVCLVECTEGGIDHEMVSDERCTSPCLDDEQLEELAAVGIKIENHFSCPQDIEWAFDKQKKLYLLQARPLHVVKTQKEEEPVHLLDAPIISNKGEPVSAGVAIGKVFKLNDIHDLVNMPRGSILVTRNSTPRLVKAVEKAAAIIAERGNTTDHMASVVREFKIPCIVKVPSAFSKLKNGQEVTVDAIHGIIYEGSFPELIREETELHEKWVDVKSTESYQLLHRLSKLIIPLHLTDPREQNFKPECCETWHDILRFCHETALNEMFQLTERDVCASCALVRSSRGHEYERFAWCHVSHWLF